MTQVKDWTTYLTEEERQRFRFADVYRHDDHYVWFFEAYRIVAALRALVEKQRRVVRDLINEGGLDVIAHEEDCTWVRPRIGEGQVCRCRRGQARNRAFDLRDGHPDFTEADMLKRLGQ